MRFPSAYDGVKKLFTSQILSLIATVCSLIAGIAGLVAVSASLAATYGEELGEAELGSMGGAFVGGGIVTILFGVAAAVLLVIAYILKLVGLKRAGNDEPRFQQAFLLAIFSLILNVAAVILRSFGASNGVVDDIVQLFGIVADIIITIMVIGGIQNLATRMGNQSIVDLGSKLLIIIIIVYVLSFIATLIPVFFGVNPGSAISTGIISVIGLILNIVAFIVFLVYLGKGKNMLKAE